MQQGLVISFITNDQPGIVERLSQIVANNQGNWLESRLSHLAGKFAGIIRVAVVSEHAESLRQSLAALASSDFSITVEDIAAQHQVNPDNLHSLSVIGLDRPGIVRDISAAIAAKGINVTEMNTDLSSAAMSAEPLFQAQVIFEMPADLNINELLAELDVIADQLGVDIDLDAD